MHSLLGEMECDLLRMPPSSISVEVEYNLGGTCIDINSDQRDLVVILFSNITWSDHIGDVTMKAYKILGLLRHTLSHSDSIHAKKLPNVSLVRSKVMYCSQVWHQYLKDK